MLVRICKNAYSFIRSNFMAVYKQMKLPRGLLAYVHTFNLLQVLTIEADFFGKLKMTNGERY
ncbi:MAG TPA: hypothetical protein DCS93_44695 [Microscillaceae bacterium]|nr:hypothetical protein [Microscillaceae bacterium]